MRRANARRGTTLIEILVALAILSLAGSALASLARQTMQSARRAWDQDAELRRASALFDAVALWTREDLDRHLGARRQGPWVMLIARDDESVYSIVLSDSTGRRELLRTALYRPRSVASAPSLVGR
jgi:prepilin-type N-terminal cleavage/methylation domain-containing protein